LSVGKSEVAIVIRVRCFQGVVLGRFRLDVVIETSNIAIAGFGQQVGSIG
jgi:hypothetical protein